MPTDLGKRQLELIAKLAALEPPLSFMGGYAEDALLAGSVTRPHEDVDVIFPRDGQELRLTQLAELGFGDWETWGEAAPGVPFYLFGQSGELKLDLGIVDHEDGNWMRVHRLSFTVAGEEAPAGYELRLPDDLFDQPDVEVEDIAIRPIPLSRALPDPSGSGRAQLLRACRSATWRRWRSCARGSSREEELLPPTRPLSAR